MSYCILVIIERFCRHDTFKHTTVPVLIDNCLHQLTTFAILVATYTIHIALHSVYTNRVRQAPGCRDLVGMRLGHGMRTETPATRIWFVTTGYLVRLLAHHPEIFNDHTHLVIDEVSYYANTIDCHVYFIATYYYCVIL
jgi:hypothetical protein